MWIQPGAHTLVRKPQRRSAAPASTACWIIRRTTRFRAAVTVYPVINWYSFVPTSGIGDWTVKRWFPGFPWDHVEHYEKRSLLSEVKNVKTPTTILTGEADYRTPCRTRSSTTRP